MGIQEGRALERRKVPTQYHLEVWKAERGLPRSVIFTILQSRSGYIWLGTLDGLICFDGVGFRIFNNKNVKAFKSNHIRTLYEDKDGKLFIGTGAGLVCLNNGKFKLYTPGDSLNQNKVKCIIGDGKGTLWVGTMGGGIFCFRLPEGKVKSFTTREGLADNLVYKLLEDSEGKIWIGTRNGLSLLENGRFTHLLIHEVLSGSEVTAIFEDREKNIWFGSDKDLIKRKDGKLKVYSSQQGFSTKLARDIWEDRDGNLWIGTDGAGLYLYRKESDTFTAFTTKNGLSDDYVYSLLEDREGNLWLGTINGGLNRLKDTLFTTYSTVEGLSHDKVWCITGDSKGNLWIGTNGGGVNCLSWMNGKSKWTTFTIQNGLSSDFISSLTEDNLGNIWIGTYKGLNRLDKSDSLISSIKKLENRHVSCVYEDRSGNLWAGTERGELYCLSKGQWKKVSANKEIPPYKIICIHEDSLGSLWIGTDGGGLSRLKNQSWTHYSSRHGLPGKIIRCVYEDREGALWIGTYDSGLFRYKNGKFVSCITKDGLLGDEVHQVLEDDRGNCWLSSNKGIIRVKKKALKDFADGKSDTLHAVFYNEADGMKSRICNGGRQPAGYKSMDGRLWFPTIGGVVVVDPANIKKNTLIPPVMIEEIIVNNEEVKAVFEPVSPIEVTFSPGTKNFEFHYTALSFLEPQKVRFKYKLEGFESQWNDVGPRRAAYYTNIPPGHYTFKVTACNNDGLWNTIGTSFTFYLKPYFYQTAWFYVAAALFVFLVVFWGYRFRMRQLINREKKLSQLVDLRTNALNERTLELEKSKQVIEKKNQNILSSIKYARRIQHAILPSDERLKSLIKDYFVLFNPRDIVSGDIYWFNQDRDLFFIAVVDCTGHGVPGAILSMIGNMKLNELISDWGISEPAQMLSHLHLGVRQALHQEKEQSMTHDGMEVALCMVDIKQNKLSFAGAKRPLYYRKDSQFYEIKGDRKPIGGAQKEKDRQFTIHEIDIDSDIIIYLTTDGFADQNDVKNKKYGSKQLKQFLQEHAHLGMKQQKEALLEELRRHQGTEEQRDDITIIGIKLENKKIAG